ncbi:hypothetical protein LTR72_002287 [Exophiala xenobiotica]|nr:hypothetical protein LTR72_002287 [Exophiala xenobiotica]KAK5487462.1 hypothetical protein LTR55_004833 [Exophiala xenobiotica]
MEALLQSGLAAKAGIPDVQAMAMPAQQPSPGSVEKEMANLVINAAGEQKYIGPSSGLSLFSPRGLAWMSRKLRSNGMANTVTKFQQNGAMWPSFRFEGRWDGSLKRSELPSKEAAVYLVDRYLKTFNRVYPLFRRDAVWDLLERQYGGSPPPAGPAFAALNAVLAIGCCLATDAVRANLQRVDPSCTESLGDMSWKFFQNAYSMFFSILFVQFDLLAVQTLVAMAFFQSSTLNPEGAFLLIGTAARVSTSLGLHRNLEGFGLPQSEIEQRQRVFWIMYAVEKDLSIRIGRPSAIDDCDVGVSILSRPCDEEIAISVGSRERVTFHPFQSMCALAVIQGRVYRELYAANARVSTTVERLESISKLDAELQGWMEQIPLEVRPEHPIQCDAEDQFPIVILHFGYYHCLTGIHRVNAHHELWVAGDAAAEDSQKSSPDSPSLADHPHSTARPESSYKLCLAAARSILYLSSTYLDGNDPNHKLLWLATYFPVSAFLALFTHILQYPLEAKVDSDLGLMGVAYDCLTKMVGSLEPSLFHFMGGILGETLKTAQQYVQDSRTRAAWTTPYYANVGQTTSAAESRVVPSHQNQLSSTQQSVYNPTATNSPGDMLSSNLFSTNILPMGPNLGNRTESFTNPSAFQNSYQPNFDPEDFVTQFAPDPNQLDTQGMMSIDDPFLLLEYGDWDWTH